MSQFKRSDDGSEQWFDQVTKQRLNERRNMQRQGNNPHNSKSYLDRKVTTEQPVEITDPYIKKLVESRNNQPFYGPAHLGGQAVDKNMAANYEVEIDMGAMEQAILRKQMEFQNQAGINPNGVSEFDINRLFGGNQTSTQQTTTFQQQPQSFQAPNRQTITINPGYPVYRPISMPGAPIQFIMARQIGTINEQLAQQQYISGGSKNVYVVSPNQTQVNIQEIHKNPNLLTILVEIQAPPMSSLGTLLVPAQAIGGGYRDQSRQLITDSRQHQFHQPVQQSQHQTAQPTKQYGYPVKRGLLKG